MPDKVLISESDATLRDFLESILTSEGKTVESVDFQDFRHRLVESSECYAAVLWSSAHQLPEQLSSLRGRRPESEKWILFRLPGETVSDSHAKLFDSVLIQPFRAADLKAALKR